MVVVLTRSSSSSGGSVTAEAKKITLSIFIFLFGKNAYSACSPSSPCNPEFLKSLQDTHSYHICSTCSKLFSSFLEKALEQECCRYESCHLYIARVVAIHYTILHVTYVSNSKKVCFDLHHYTKMTPLIKVKHISQKLANDILFTCTTL